MKQNRQLEMFAQSDEPMSDTKDTSSTFVKNMSLPVHRWYRFSAGFSAQWAQQLIEKSHVADGTSVFDPFAGSGTTLLAAESAGVQSVGLEAHPFVWRIAAAKLKYRIDPMEYSRFATQVLNKAKSLSPSGKSYPPLINKCYEADSLDKLDCLRVAVDLAQNGSDAWDLTWLTLVVILRPCSSVGTAQWQYILPNKRKARTRDPFEAFAAFVNMFQNDMETCQQERLGVPAKLLQSDARTCKGVENDSVSLVVTSPPYANNYDYADATRLEMSFFGEIDSWGDLQTKVRSHLMRSCTQHVPQKSVQLESILSSPELQPIATEIAEICEKLEKVRLTKGGRKNYHLMAACYFFDLAQVWRALRRVCASTSEVCFVIGDSAPYGIYLPVIEWLGKLALAAGFDDWSFEKTRDRNLKWKNRKHRVPLCEGRLWVKG